MSIAVPETAAVVEQTTDRHGRPFVREDFWQGSNRLYVCFGGLDGSLGLPLMEFCRTGRILDYSRILLRDPHLAWFQRGIPAIGETVHEVADFIQQRIEASGAKEIRFVGSKMGGYAALLFCSLLNRGRAVVFSPQTFIEPEKLKRLGDDRALGNEPFIKLLDAMTRHRSAEHIYDLQALLEIKTPNLAADVYVSSASSTERLHANELSGFKNIKIHAVENGERSLLALLSQSGQLAAALAA